MKISDNYDALLQKHIDLEDRCKALAEVVCAVHACAKPQEAAELDDMTGRDPAGTDSALAIMITPAVWTSVKRHQA